MLLNNDFWYNKKVFITGHNGFKGAWMTLWLLRLKAEIMGYSLYSPSDPSLFSQLNIESKIKQVIGDINNKEFLEKKIIEFNPDFIFHLAAQPLVKEGYLSPLSTWNTNVIGSINILEASRKLKKKCCVIMVTTDKVYLNKEWNYSYREDDKLGGHDPYSSSKAAAEIAINSWRLSFTGKRKYQSHQLLISSVRSGNVIGGGDWAKYRLIPDIIRALEKNKEIKLRFPKATRPWQHVLEPLHGYIILAEKMFKNPEDKSLLGEFNFGPLIQANKTVENVVKDVLEIWPGSYTLENNSELYHEASLLNLSIDKSFHILNWQPKWNYKKTIEKTISWYKKVLTKEFEPIDCCNADIDSFERE